ncbi:NADH-quinone oxidoreductase subunit N [Salsipaludibacter albus]|uniref:NADH-quinone oxidoreductase subunit N n=1 Tax=Salsipaludibacter albus TaxID=2849650 RepID=UPI001EE4A675|nr:NADH-quinone oxidoreductase subunit N [Salsipaludibacter albus]
MTDLTQFLPDIAWSSVAPEIAMTVAVVVLLLMTVAGRRRMWVATPMGLAIAGVGVALLVVESTSPADPSLPGLLAIVAGVALVALTFGLAGVPRALHAWIAGLGAGAALVLTAWQIFDVAWTGSLFAASTTMEGSVAMDGLAIFTRITVYLSTLLVLPIGFAYVRDRNIHRPEFEPLLLLSAVGMALLGAANDVITLFIALEVLSIALYVLTGSARRDRRSQEAAVKYFVLGAVASAILLYGFALSYIATGSLELPGIALGMADPGSPLRLLAVSMVLVLVGVGFKVALVPFQLWVPDVYEGAPTNVTAFMGAATKAAGFAAMLRLFVVAWAPLADLWVPIVAVLAGLSMAYGAWAALVQDDVKRLLAYSAVAHAGYATIGIVSLSDAGLSATMWYLFTYAITSITALGGIIAIERRNHRAVSISDLNGLGRTSPALAAVMSLALLSLAGIPPTLGFEGKLGVFTAGMLSGLTWLVVLGVVTSVVSAFYYLRLMGAMFLTDPAPDAPVPAYSHGWNAGVTVAAGLIVYLGLQPSILLDLAERAAVLAR